MGVPQGLGTYIYRNGNTYTGNFIQGKKSGQGKLDYVNSKTKETEWFYEGEWKEDKKHGFGTLEWKNGSKFQGFFKEDQRTGHGQMTWINGDFYDGMWLNGKMHGKGKKVIKKTGEE